MKKSIIILTAGVLLSTMPILAGPLLKKQVSSRASWLAHTDHEQFKKTLTGQLIRKELVNLGIEEHLSNFATISSFHPLDDVRNVTIYGTGKDREKAVVLIEGEFDKEQVLTLVRMNPQYKEIKYGDIVLYEWFDENQKDPNGTAGQMTYGCFYQDDLIVMGVGQEGVKHAVDVLRGSAENAANVIFSRAAQDAKGAFFQAMALNVAEIVGEQQETAALKQTNQVGLAVGESEGNFYINLDLTAKSEEAAQAVTKMLEGIIAFAVLSGEEQPKLADLAKKVKVNCENKTVRVHFESAPESVVQFLKDQWQKKKEQDSKE
ncbi:MAG TPA: hypothetical protein HPP66_11395 [Planctomycetes bacterium]|nr:hypothetical protein [Planctomycetota bacterium]